MKEDNIFYYNDLCFIIKDKKTVTCILEYYEEGRYYCQQTLKGGLVIPSKAIDERNGKEYLVTEIGAEAFLDCKGLTSVFIPASVIKIGDYAFHGCNGLNSIVVDINNHVYDSRESCNAIIETETNTLIVGCNNTIIPSSVRTIADGAFWDCGGLTFIVIPKSVENIGLNAFYGCSGLTSIKVEEGNKKYDSRGECNALIETANNTLIKGSNNAVIPSSVTKIEDGAFEGCSGLISVVIPDSVTEMGVSAFAGCMGLTEVKISNSLKTIDESAFYGCENLTEVTIPDSVTQICDLAFSGCTKLAVINIRNSVIDIWEDAFSNTAWFNNQPDGMVYARSVAYRYKGEMTDEITSIKEGCKSIADAAFKGCKKLKKVIMPDTVTAIGTEAFYGCNNLTSLILGNSVKLIGHHVFDGCKNLVSFVISNAETKIGFSPFGNCDNLKEIFCNIKNPQPCTLPTHGTTIYIPQGTLQSYLETGIDKNMLVELSDEKMEHRIAELKRQKI